MIDAFAGLTFQYVGGLGMSFGSRPPAALICVCTSCAAPSMLRLRSNCRTMLVIPNELDEVICVTPETFDSIRSNGVATDVAMVCALAPGSLAWIWMVGKSTS